MNDQTTPSEDASEQSATGSVHEGPSAEVPSAETPPREPKPRVFGRWANMILVVPFVVYLGGNMTGSYLESIRIHVLIKNQQSAAMGALEQLQRAYTNPRLHGGRETDLQRHEELKAEFEELCDYSKLKDAIADEDHTPESIREGAVRLMAANINLDRIQEVDLGSRTRKDVEALATLLEVSETEADEEVFAFYEDHQREMDREGLLDEDGEVLDQSALWFPPTRRWYPTTYSATIAVTTLLVLLVFPGYLKAPLNLSYLSIVVGVAGIFVWIGLYYFDHNFLGLGAKFGATRPAFNPFERLKDNPTWLNQFLAIRFWGLVVIVPLVEEFFLRGFLMRYIDSVDWDEIPLGQATWWAIGGIAAYGAVAHPSEALAAIIWFSMVTWLYLRTKSIWNCVIAHSITNLLLGLYVIKTGAFELW